MLELSNYFIIDSTDNKPRKDLENLELTNRGIIFKSLPDDNHKMVASTFPYTEEFGINNIVEIENLMIKNEYSFYKSYEGTIIRVIHDEQEGVIKRLVATHKKLDAFESYWGSYVSYGELFQNEIYSMFLKHNPDSELSNDKVFELFLDSLDTSLHYTFLLTSNDENKIVSSLNNKIFFAGSFDRETNKYNPPETTNSSQLFPFDIPEQINFKTSQDIIDYIEKVDYKESQGILAIQKDEFKLFKVINDEYSRKTLLRGNNSSLIHRYLQLKFIGDDQMFFEFMDLFNYKIQLFQQIESDIQNLALYIHSVYYARYIEKTFVYVNPVFHSVLKSIHYWHNMDKRKNITTLKVVYQKLQETDYNTVYKLMKEYKKLCEEGKILL